WTLAKYDAQNPAALKRLLANGVILSGFSNEVMAACYKASEENYEEVAYKNAKGKKVWRPGKNFRADSLQWFSIAENRADKFMVSTQRMAQKASGKKG